MGFYDGMTESYRRLYNLDVYTVVTKVGYLYEEEL